MSESIEELLDAVDGYFGGDFDDAEHIGTLLDEARHELSNHPLVVTYVGGGLVQDQSAYPGIGLPELIVIDWDKENADHNELVNFVNDMTDLVVLLRKRPENIVRNQEIDRLYDAIVEYRGLISNRLSAGRYR